MNKISKIILSGALTLIQLAAIAIPLFGSAYFIREFGGDNDDVTFTPAAARRWKAAMMLALFLAIWAGQLYATTRALLKMWRKHPVTSSERKN